MGMGDLCSVSHPDPAVKGEVVLILREGKMMRDLQSFVFPDLKLLVNVYSERVRQAVKNVAAGLCMWRIK